MSIGTDHNQNMLMNDNPLLLKQAKWNFITSSGSSNEAQLFWLFVILLAIDNLSSLPLLYEKVNDAQVILKIDKRQTDFQMACLCTEPVT